MVRYTCLTLFLYSCLPITASSGTIDRVWCNALGTSGDTVVIHFASTQDIESFQKLEQTADKIIVRFPSSVIHESAIDSACGSVGVAIKQQQIRDFAVYNISSISHNGEARIVRVSSKQVDVLIAKLSKPVAGATPPAISPTNKNWKLEVIVIDAGHGGVDAGAEGVNGVFEKNITLAIAKRLRELVKDAMPATKVVMTRETDTFVELYKRTQIANEAKGKLFISIHCNSMPTKPHPARGCETYILRPGRNADATNVAARENASIQFEKSKDRYAGLDEDRLIVATMAQRSFVRFSEERARQIQSSMKQNSPLKDRGVNQAGFYVLVSASMPNVLFETAFISNPEDAAYISSAKGQLETAESMLAAIQNFARTYEKAVGR